MKSKYTVLSPVDHDKTRYEIGASIDLEENEAKGLLDVKAIELAPEAQSAPADEAERIAAIVDAIGQLDKANAALWTNAGTPKTDGLTAITGWPVVAKDRDAAWAKVNSAK